MTKDEMINYALKHKLNEGEKILDKKSECCKSNILFTKNSGVYICPGIYCSKCKKLLSNLE